MYCCNDYIRMLISYIHWTFAFPHLELPASSHTPFAYFPIIFFLVICQNSLYILNNILLSIVYVAYILQVCYLLLYLFMFLSSRGLQILMQCIVF